MAIFFPGTRVDWVLDTGARFPGTVQSVSSSPSFFPGEVKWNVLLDNAGVGGANRVLESRDLVEIGLAGADVSTEILSGSQMETGGNVLVMEPGADLRDSGIAQAGAGIGLAVGGGAVALRTIVSRLGPAAGPIIAWARQFGRGAIVRWEQIPAFVRTILVTVGIVGVSIAIDEAIDGGGGGDGVIQIGGPGHMTPHLIDGHLGAHVVGSWIANGVTFYRLSDGKLAVQNKRGRWKVWRPKKPIVIMPTGAVDLRTLLRADAVLNRQAKRIASMLNRRSPRPRAAKKQAGGGETIVVVDGKAVKT